jgi:hypothetical protein
VNLGGTIVAGNDRRMLHDKMQELLEAGGTNFILDLGQVTFPEGTVLAFSPDMSAPLTRNRAVAEAVLNFSTKRAEAHYVV